MSVMDRMVCTQDLLRRKDKRGAGGDKTRRSVASRGTAPPRASRQIGGIDPQRWGRGSREENGAPKRRRKEQRERARHELTSRLAASLSATSRSQHQPDGAQAAERVDLDDREWDSAGGSVSGGDSEDDSQGVKAKMGSRGKRRRVVQLDPPQTKYDPLRAVISSRMSARPNWQRQGGFRDGDYADSHTSEEWPRIMTRRRGRRARRIAPYGPSNGWRRRRSGASGSQRSDDQSSRSQSIAVSRTDPLEDGSFASARGGT